MALNKSKIIRYKGFGKIFDRSGNANSIFEEMPLEKIIMSLIDKHNEILKSINNDKVKAVAFNFLYSADGRIIDINDLYIHRTKEIENIFIANKFSTSTMAKTGYIDSWRSLGGKAFEKKSVGFMVPKYLVISKRGINKSKLDNDQIYYYNHLDILMSNKATFDRLLDSSIVARSESIIKWASNPIVPEIQTGCFHSAIK